MANVNLTDADGFLWDISNDGNGYAPGSMIDNGSIDAFDWGFVLSVDGTAFSGSFAPAELNGRQLVVTGSVGYIDVARRIYVPDSGGEGWARFLESFTNNGSSAVTISITIQTNSGNDFGMRVLQTSSGDTSFTTADRWIINDDSNTGDSAPNSSDPTVVHVFADGRLAPTSVSTTVFEAAGNQGVEYTYNLTIPAGQTVSFLHFGSQQWTMAGINSELPSLSTPDAAALYGLTLQQMNSVANFNLIQTVNFDLTVPGYPDSYSEDGLTFTSPTHLHFDYNDMDGDGHFELGGHNGGTETIEITKTGGGSFSLIDMDTDGFFGGASTGLDDPVEWIGYRLVGGVYVETGRMVILPGGPVTFTSDFHNIDKVVWNSAYTTDGGMRIDNLRYTGAVAPNNAPNSPTDSDPTGDSATADATIAEDHAVGTAIGLDADATDPDAGDSVSYSFGFDGDGNPILTSGNFAIAAASGVVTLASALNYELASSYTLRIYATDQDGASSYTDFTVEVTNVTEPPVLGGTSSPQSVTEASSALGSGETIRATLFGSATVADPESTLTGATVSISANFQSGSSHQDYLRINGSTSGTVAGTGISFAYNQSTGVMTLTGTGTVSEYQSALRLVTFSTSGDDVTAGGSATSRTITATVTDGTATSNSLQNTVTVTGINDGPGVVTGGDGAATEDAGAQSITGIVVSDADISPTQKLSLNFEIWGGAGTLSIEEVPGGIQLSDIVGGGNGTAGIVVQATLAQVNATLSAGGLKYTPAPDFHGTAQFVMSASDQGANGNDPGISGGGTYEDVIASKSIIVAEANDAPNSPTDSDPTGDSATADATIAEDHAVGTAIGLDADATDPDAGDSVSYSFGFDGDGNPILTSGNFAIAATSGVVTLASALNYELASSYTLRIYATDQDGASSYTDFTVEVTNVTEHLFTTGDDSVDFNALPDGAYDLDGAQYDALAGNDSVVLPNLASVDAGNPWDYTQTFEAGEGNDSIVGGDGDDIVDGGAGNDVLSGVGGDDELHGGDGSDSVRGLEGDDFVYGEGGDDFVRGHAGDDYIDGGDGYDRVAYFNAAGGVMVDLTKQGIAQDTVNDGWDTLVGIEHVSGSQYSDTIIGDAGDNWLWSGASVVAIAQSDTISGGEGDDLIEVGPGGHILDGGAGTDTLMLFGNATDISSAGVRFSLAQQGAAQDTRQGMMVATGFENLSGSIYGDELIGDGGANVLAGDRGNDTLVGAAGDDTLYGDGEISIDTHGTGNSGPITTWADIATSFGLTPGNDTLEGGLGNDALDGGGGSDTATYANASGGVTVDLAAGTASGADGNDTLVNMENVTGSAHGDTLTGDANANTLSGGNGNDRLTGGGGGDSLIGGAGADTYAFTATNDSAPAARDVITGFSGQTVLTTNSKGKPVKVPGEGDKLDLSAIDANTSVAGDQAFTLSSKFTGVAGQAYSAYNSGTGVTSVFLDTNGDKVADMTIELLGNVNLTGADFVL